jgi:hypothetical protein
MAQRVVGVTPSNFIFKPSAEKIQSVDEIGIHNNSKVVLLRTLGLVKKDIGNSQKGNRPWANAMVTDDA